MPRLTALLALLLAAHAAPAGAVSMGGDAPLSEAPAAPGAAQPALAALARGDLAAAERGFSDLLRAQPASALAHLGLADLRFRAGDAAGAEALLRQGIAANGDTPEAAALWRALARLQGRTGRVEEMLAAFGEARRIAPRDPTNPLQLANILHQRLGRPADALPLYEMAIALAPDLADAHYGGGLALARVGRPAEALAPLARAAVLAPQSGLPDHARGQVLAGLGRPGEALAAYDRALTREPGLLDTRLARGGLLLAALARPADAAAEYTRAAALAPQLAGPRIGLGIARERAGDAAGAERAYREALEREAANPIAQNNLAWLLASQRRSLDEALALAERASAALPGEPGALTTLGWVRRQRGELAEAEPLLARAVAAQPTAERLARLGTVRAELGRRPEAEADFRRALELDPAQPLAREGLARPR